MRPKLTEDVRQALCQLDRHDGWMQTGFGPTGRHPYRELVRLGFAEGNGHGKFRLTDDGREYLDRPRTDVRIHAKAGARRQPCVRSATPGIADAVRKRRTYGCTEKILRRNRKTWTRLANKRRRALDKTRAQEAS